MTELKLPKGFFKLYKTADVRDGRYISFIDSINMIKATDPFQVLAHGIKNSFENLTQDDEKLIGYIPELLYVGKDYFDISFKTETNDTKKTKLRRALERNIESAYVIETHKDLRVYPIKSEIDKTQILAEIVEGIHKGIEKFCRLDLDKPVKDCNVTDLISASQKANNEPEENCSAYGQLKELVEKQINDDENLEELLNDFKKMLGLDPVSVLNEALKEKSIRQTVKHFEDTIREIISDTDYYISSLKINRDTSDNKISALVTLTKDAEKVIA